MNALNLHWRYFASLEDDLAVLSRFVELTEDNFGVYSVEIVRLYLSSCSEIDAVLKLICAEIAPEKKVGTITEYQAVISAYHYAFFEEKVIASNHGLEFVPWKDWAGGASPDWWKQHNVVKHNRSENYEKANLGNFLNALSALFVLLFYLYQLQSANESPSRNCHVTDFYPQPRILFFPDIFRYFNS